MLALEQTKTFKKCLKKYRHKKPLLKELTKVIGMLLNNQELPEKYHDHELKGKYKGIRELHVKPDDLLLYVKVNKERLTLMALGGHSEIF